MRIKGCLLSIYVLLGVNQIYGEIITLTTLGIIAAGAGYFSQCYFKECCNHGSIYYNETDLGSKLYNKVYGQHIALEIIQNAIEQHYTKKNPRKPLAISFHGTTGTGKNFVSSFIVNSVYRKGFNSQYVHKFVGRQNFTLERLKDSYKTNLLELIQSSVQKCPQSIFIFDEVEKMIPGLIDVVAPFLTEFQPVNRIDFRKATFIFLSNLGGNLIRDRYLQLREQGKKRQDMTFLDFQHILRAASFNTEGGFHEASIIFEYDLNWFIPFLPMEEEHVKMCIQDELSIQVPGYIDSDVSDTMAKIVFENGLSISGCRLVRDIVAVVKQKKSFY